MMKITDWKAIAEEFASRLYTKREHAEIWPQVQAQHTREVPEGLATRLHQVVDGLRALVAESRGVTGYHLNGELAPWGDFAFVRALGAIEVTPEACAALDADAEQWRRWGPFLALDQPWSTPEALRRLVSAALHLLDVHGCDTHGHEGIRDAARAANEALRKAGKL